MPGNFHMTEYITYLDVEEGFSPNTIEAYLHDVERYISYLTSREIHSPSQVNKDIVTDYIEYLRENGLSISSVARNFFAVRSYHLFLYHEQKVLHNPTEVVEVSPLKRKLPDVLNIEEVFRLLESPDMTKPLGIRIVPCSNSLTLPVCVFQN